MRKLSLWLLALTWLAACQKADDAPAPAPVSRTDLLTARSWRLSAATTTVVATGAPPVITDDYAQLPACERDDFRQFNVNKILFVDAGALRCDPNDPQVRRFSWAFGPNETQLLISSLTGTLLNQYDLVELTASTLRLRETTVSGSTTRTQSLMFTAF